MSAPGGPEGVGVGVRFAGSGSALPERALTNADLERLMDTTDDWILQRTGIRERRVVDRAAGESVSSLGAAALCRALESARMEASELDLLIVATMTPESSCPPTACRVASLIGAGTIGAWDVSAACCGFVFSLNNAYGLIRSGQCRSIAVIGADTISRHMSYDDAGRGTAILFGDAAGAVILRATDDASRGLIAQAMHSDGGRWADLYISETVHDFPEGHEPDERRISRVQMNGKAVFKFAVGTFQEVIGRTLDRAGLTPEEVDHFVCHQSNARILQAARERFGLPAEKLHVNIDRYGNTVAASVPLCLDELWKAGRVREGQRVMFVAFGGGLTWGTSLWQM